MRAGCSSSSSAAGPPPASTPLKSCFIFSRWIASSRAFSSRLGSRFQRRTCVSQLRDIEPVLGQVLIACSITGIAAVFLLGLAAKVEDAHVVLVRSAQAAISWASARASRAHTIAGVLLLLAGLTTWLGTLSVQRISGGMLSWRRCNVGQRVRSRAIRLRSRRVAPVVPRREPFHRAV